MSNRQFNAQSSGGFNILPVLIFGILFMVALFYVAKVALAILWYLIPVLLIATLIIDHKVILNYGKWLFAMLGKSPLLGAGLVLLSIVGAPVVSLFLFGKAMLKKKVKEMTQQFETEKEGEFVEYEEVKPENEGWVELPSPPVREKKKQTRRSSSNEYEDLFEED